MMVNRQKWMEFIEFAKKLTDYKVVDAGQMDVYGLEVLIDGDSYNKFSLFKFNSTGIVQVIVFSPGLGAYSAAFSTEVPEIAELWDLFGIDPKLVDEYGALEQFMERNK